MPMINDRYYANPAYGKAMEAGRMAGVLRQLLPWSDQEQDGAAGRYAIERWGSGSDAPQAKAMLVDDKASGTSGGNGGGGGNGDDSWMNEILGVLGGRNLPTPPDPTPPSVDKQALEQSVDASPINTLKVHDVGLIVYNETKSFSGSDDSSESIDD